MSSKKPSSVPGEWKIHLSSALVCGFFLLAGVYFDRQSGIHQVALACYMISYVAGGWDALIEAWSAGFKGKLDIHFLMLAVAIGAAFIGAWWEGSVLLFLFSLSGALEAMAMARTEKEIRSLFQDSPKAATRVNADGSLVEIPVDSLAVGDRVRIFPGSQFPVDACVVLGATAADESMLTGESVPVEKGLQDTVFGGTLNTWGALDAEVLRLPSESAHGKIIRLIRDAQASKAPSQRFTDRFGTTYTLSILALSFAAFAWWHWVQGMPAFGTSAADPSALYRAMTLLVVCSPCALVISIPSAILAGIASAARRGVLFRGGVALENLATIQRLAVDKTGTLTKGDFVITAIESFPESGKQVVLESAAALSQQSTHPLSRAIAAEWLKQHGARAGAIQDYQSLAGQGVEGNYQGQAVKQGRRSYFSAESAVQKFPNPEPGYTEVLVDAGVVAGRIILRDAPRLESKAMIQRLHAMGIKVTMLTGDRPESAALLSKELGLDDSRSGLHPEDKVAAIAEWRNQGEVVAMVGDGINDAPSLAVADISIGMGLRGSDAVLEQADVILLNDRLDNVLTALTLSRRCRSIIRQNLVISLSVLVLLCIGSIGYKLPLPLGVLGHEGSTLIVVLNSLRLLMTERKNKLLEVG
ncbi:MAG: cadmium-translocating P-type ATPase [Verrucomicrobiia bacterium Tous-C3TDCM]|nr:MAG: cadmium-translocating P-type ATPase [Verrucomicrobiae bacterium Tous-C3TDCM]PAZ05657.1 MAG: cadmium-translocating P-type ATPase [Verrucomicrobiae bacterium AMD-G2]